MSSVLYRIIIYILWINKLFNGTVLGQAYHTTEQARIIVYIIAIVIAVIKYAFNRNLSIDTEDLLVFSFLFAFFVLDSLLNGFNLMGLDYLWVFFLIYLLSKFPVSELSLKIIGIGYAVAGIIVLAIYNFGTALSGWNPNSIAMIGLHSFLVFIIPFYQMKSFKGKIPIALVAILYVWLLSSTDSRSCMIFIIVGVLFSFSIIPQKIITASNRRILFWLLIPLVVAIVIVLISKGPYMEALNKWSYEQYNKPLFNGRDTLWEQGFRILFEHPFFGTGEIGSNRHNTIVECLIAYGIIGLLIWLFSLYKLLSKGRLFLDSPNENDNIIIGCIVSFFVFYVQQTVELGMFSTAPNIIPYMIIGIMFGRIKLLTSNNEIKQTENA